MQVQNTALLDTCMQSFPNLVYRGTLALGTIHISIYMPQAYNINRHNTQTGEKGMLLGKVL